MKKMIALSAMALILLTGTSAFAETGSAKKMSDGLYNGITYFDMASAVPGCNSISTELASSGSNVVLSNGITFFGAIAQVTKAKNVCACGTGSKENRAWQKNGITVFS